MGLVVVREICYKQTMELLPSATRRRAALASLLQDQNPDVRDAAARSLEQVENRSKLNDVLDLLKRGSLVEKIQAIFALGAIGGDKVLPALKYCAARPEVDIRVAALEVLGTLAAPTTYSVVAAALDDPNRAVKVKAIIALGRLRNPDASPLLLPCLDAGDGLIDAEAARALGNIGCRASEERLIALLGSSHATTREAAAEALGNLPVG